MGAPLPRLSWVSTTRVDVLQPLGYTTTRVTLQDALARTFTGTLTWDPSTGVVDGGLDAGVEAANTWYYLYLVPSTAAPTTTLHVRGSVNAPTTGPTGYTNFRFIGAVRNDSGSNVLKFYQTGQRFLLDQYLPQLMDNSGFGSDVGRVEIQVGQFIPDTASHAYIQFYSSAGFAEVFLYVRDLDGPYAIANAESNGNNHVISMPIRESVRSYWRRRAVNCSHYSYLTGWLDPWIDAFTI